MTERINRSFRPKTRSDRADPLAGLNDAAANLRIRAALMMVLKQRVISTGLGQAQAAKLFQVTQPRISGLMCGKVALFGLDALVNMAVAAGLRVELRLANAVAFKARFSAPSNLPFIRQLKAPSTAYESISAEPSPVVYAANGASLKSLLLPSENTNFDCLRWVTVSKADIFSLMAGK